MAILQRHSSACLIINTLFSWSEAEITVLMRATRTSLKDHITLVCTQPELFTSQGTSPLVYWWAYLHSFHLLYIASSMSSVWLGMKRNSDTRSKPCSAGSQSPSSAENPQTCIHLHEMHNMINTINKPVEVYSLPKEMSNSETLPTLSVKLMKQILGLQPFKTSKFSKILFERL